MTKLSKEAMREYMRKRREAEKYSPVEVLGNPESVVDTATTEETGEVTPESEETTIRVRLPEAARLEGMTPCDRLFERARPAYYIFNQDAVGRQCWVCGKAFKTRMELNKFCSPKCKDGYLDEAFGKMRK